MESQISKEWQSLKTNWESALKASASAQREIDDIVDRHLHEGGPPPSKQQRLQVEDLFSQQCEARGALDQFIEENCG